MKKDWTQYTNVAAQNPQKVQEMKDLMFGEFAMHQVLPLDGSAASRFITPRPSLAAGRTSFTFTGATVTDIPAGNMPSLLNSSYTITADVDMPSTGADGMIVNEGGRFWGYALYVLKGSPVFTYNMLGIKRTRWQGTPLSAGKHTIVFDFRYDGLGPGTLAYNSVSGIGRGGTGTLKVDGAVVATEKMALSLPSKKPLDTVFNIGAASGTSVDDADYQVPFSFGGAIKKINIELDRPKLSPADIEKLKQEEMEAFAAK